MIIRLLLVCFAVSGFNIASANSDRLILVGASYGKNVLAICDGSGKVLWQMTTAGPEKGHAGHHDIHLLENGNILFHDSWTRTQEISLDKQVIWQYDSKTANGNEGKKVDVHAFKRLANGDTVLVESGVGRIIHVNAEGAVHPANPAGSGRPQENPAHAHARQRQLPGVRRAPGSGYRV